MKTRRNLILTYLLLSVSWLRAEVKVAEVFTSHMVLQQQKDVKVWGTADAGETVMVSFGRQKVRTTASADGKWQAVLKPMKASAKPLVMTVRGRKNTIRLSDVLVGEVWLASGQSNMEYTMKTKYARPKESRWSNYQEQALSEAANPNIRLLHIEKNLKQDTLPTRGWQVCTPETVAPFSAAAYFFARMLQDSLQVPVGIINTSWGGTKIEVWMPEKGDRWTRMVKPMAGYALRGFLWYQGETNLINGDIDEYIPKMEKMVADWRQAWNDEVLPFYYVQISPMTYSHRKDYADPKTWLDLPRFWTAQTECLRRIKHTGMVVTTDLPDDLDDIHPPYKWKVGERLCLLALNRTYGHTQTECCGPVLESAKVEDGKAVLTFSHADGGLITSDGKEPDWFYTNKTNGRCYKAKAFIDGNRVIVDLQPNVTHPIIRFGYDEVGQPNLRNHAGLPAQPFEVKL